MGGYRVAQRVLSARQFAAQVVCVCPARAAAARASPAPLTYADEHPPQRGNPVAPARRSPSASAKAARKTGPGKQPIRGFRDILDHLATLTRNELRYGPAVVPALAEPTPDQRRAFDLIGAPYP
jgi:hypothetical protein